jgi:hypothetical protein
LVEANNDGETEEWEAAMNALEVFESTANVVSAHEQDYWMVNSTGGDVAEDRGLQMTPLTTQISTATPDPPASVHSLPEFGLEGENDNARFKDSIGLEGW